MSIISPKPEFMVATEYTDLHRKLNKIYIHFFPFLLLSGSVFFGTGCVPIEYTESVDTE